MKREALSNGRGYEIPCIWQVAGEESLVCIVAHGFGSSMESPTAQMLLAELPKRGMGAVAFDFPAHGASPVDGDFLRLEHCLGDLAAVEAEARARARAPGAEIVYVGSSFGAYVTLLYLSEGRGRGRRAFLRSAAVCMPALFHNRPPEEEARMAADGCVTLGADWGYSRPLKITRGFREDLDGHDVFARWRREAGAVRMIHGGDDKVIPLAEAERFAAAFGIPLSVVPGGDHSLSIPGAPERVLAEALAFFSGG